MLNTVCKCVSHSQLAAIIMMMYMGFQGKQLKSVCAWFPLFLAKIIKSDEKYITLSQLISNLCKLIEIQD